MSLAGVLIRQEELPRATDLYYPHFFRPGGVPAAAVRSRRYKLIKKLRTGALELYDLLEDPAERRNLVELKPVLATRLHGRLRRHIRHRKRASDP